MLPAIRDRTSLDWLLLASMVAMAFNTHGDPVSLVIFLSLVGTGFIRPRVLRLWWLWIGIAVVQGGVQLLRWEGIDDHVIVGTYWALAVGLAMASGQPERVLRTSARLMIGLIFLFAATWKISTREFRDGSFFTLYLLADPRFQAVAQVVGGVPAQDFEANRDLIGSLYEVGGRATEVRLGVGPRISALATVMTGWGIAIESILAVSWLAPLKERLTWIRHVSLLAFCITTYGLVAITGFGTILLVMGMATTPDGSVWRRVYGVGIVVLALWTPLWSAFLA